MFRFLGKLFRIDKLVAEEVEKKITELQHLKKTRAKKEHSLFDSTILQPNVEYVLLARDCPTAFRGILDLSELRHGDSLEVSVLMSVDGGKPKLNHKRVFAGPLDEPIIDFPERYAESLKVTAKLLTGQPREIMYRWYWR